MKKILLSLSLLLLVSSAFAESEYICEIQMDKSSIPGTADGNSSLYENGFRFSESSGLKLSVHNAGCRCMEVIAKKCFGYETTLQASLTDANGNVVFSTDRTTGPQTHCYVSRDMVDGILSDLPKAKRLVR